MGQRQPGLLEDLTVNALKTTTLKDLKCHRTAGVHCANNRPHTVLQRD